MRVGDAPLVRVQLRRPGPAVAAGGVLCGTMDFWGSHGAPSGGTAPRVRCLAVAISLDTEERVAAARAASKNGGSAAPGAAAAAGHTLRRVRDEAAEATADTLCTSFCFSLPTDAPPSFVAGPVSHAWCLVFDFSLAPAAPGAAPSTLRWSVPVAVGAPVHRAARDAAAATL